MGQSYEGTVSKLILYNTFQKKASPLETHKIGEPGYNKELIPRFLHKEDNVIHWNPEDNIKPSSVCLLFLQIFLFLYEPKPFNF